MILLERCSISQARQAAESFRRSVADFHFSWCGQDFSINASVGVVPVDADTPGTVELLSGAAGACINVKVTGRNRVFIAEYNPGDIRDLRGEARWVPRTNKALENNRFRLFRQSIDAVESDGGKPKHFELLLRLETKEGDMVSPYAFLGAAERYNLVTRIDQWVTRTAFHWLRHSHETTSGGGLYSINLSAQSLVNRDFLTEIVEQLEEHPVLEELVCFEITETAAISNRHDAMHFIETRSAKGCRFALDDLGAGLCSFAYLRQPPVDN